MNKFTKLGAALSVAATIVNPVSAVEVEAPENPVRILTAICNDASGAVYDGKSTPTFSYDSPFNAAAGTMNNKDWVQNVAPESSVVPDMRKTDGPDWCEKDTLVGMRVDTTNQDLFEYFHRDSPEAEIVDTQQFLILNGQ